MQMKLNLTIAYRKYSAWHYVNFKEGEAYETGEKNPKGDLVQGIKDMPADNF